MKILGLLLLVSGWFIVIGALALLSPEISRTIFLLAGIGVEIVGLALLGRSHPLMRGERE
jgi:hypothetical protein